MRLRFAQSLYPRCDRIGSCAREFRVADHLRGDERVGAGAGAEVEHPFAGREPAELPGVCDPANEPTAVSGTLASSTG